MKQKLFYNAFSIICDELKTALNLTQKEAVFDLMFGKLYQCAGVEIFDYDQFRKITSGANPFHSKVRKKLHTYDGFELFRSEIEINCLPYLKNTLPDLIEIFNRSENIPQEVKSQICTEITDDYHVSRTIAAILDCLDYSDHLVSKGKNSLFDVGYMRLSANNAPTKHPKYLTESPENGVELIGRKDDIDILHEFLIKKKENILVTAVGGLGKTELVKKFISEIREKDVNECDIEIIAWVQYNNNDLRMSVKQAFHMKCEIDEVWTEIQNISDKYGKRMLLVVDNIEASDDEYLRKLSQLSCRILVTSRNRKLSGFNEKLELQPLSMEDCRELFYRHYRIEERNNEILNDIIELTAKLTIMIVFIAKAAFSEGFSLLELYAKLVEKGFKLSEEDVSCEHEKMQNDETIIRQMCILFSLVKYSDEDKKILTYISVIPNLKFDFTKAKKWFNIRKNSSLLSLFNVGMLEYIMEKRTHIYWMHSVIAAAIREQQKEILYEQCAPFIHELSEELECGEYWGTAYTKLDLIPFSWSVADLLENNLNNEDDATFLIRLFYVCFEASNYPLCKKRY
ncbi:MAG: NB-ARC domain-containing protein [Alistipes sp.]|nr:NB-ARC domain-containing protein [Alistipes sp.]